jgi:transcriptional regulator with XRE-family HTH domain
MANRRPETLGDFVRRIRKEKSLSLADVSEQSARFGQRITISYINRIENDPQRRVTTDRLTALANGLGVPMEELFTRATGLSASTRKFSDELHLLTRFRELSAERKADVLKIVEMWYSEESSRRSLRPPLSIVRKNKQTVQ